MLLESISYTASVIDYIAQYTKLPVAEVAEKIGVKGLTRLCHNAPMNKHLPIGKIAAEIIADYPICYRYPCGIATFRDDYGRTIMAQVEFRTADKHQYASVLYDILTTQTEAVE